MRSVFVNDIFVDEEKAGINFRDLALQRGYGIFDFFKVKDKIPVFLDDHLDRFYFSAEQMHLKPACTRIELKEVIYELIQKNQITETGIRITLTGGYSSDGFQPGVPNLIIAQQDFKKPDPQIYRKGIKLVLYPYQRQLPQVKTIDYLMAIWLQPWLNEKAADDILYHDQQQISECPRSNFFIVTKDEEVITPGRNILKGVTRKHVLNLSKQYYQTIERDITLSDLQQAQEAFITSTTKTIVPVSQIDGHELNTDRNTVTRKLMTLINA